MKKNSNWIFTTVIIVLFVGALVLIAQRGGKSSEVATVSGVSSGSGAGMVAGTALSAEETAFDFGDISMRKGKVARSFVVRNATEKPLIVNKMYTSCMCTTAAISLNGKRYGPFGMPGHGFTPTIKAELAPGESGEVEVVFDPAAHGPAGVGRISRVVYLENTAGAPLELVIAANVTP